MKKNIQSCILLLGAALSICTLLFPPWRYLCLIEGDNLNVKIQRTGPMASVLVAPKIPMDEFDTSGSTAVWKKFIYAEVDYARLVLIISAITILTVTPLIAFNIRNKSE